MVWALVTDPSVAAFRPNRRPILWAIAANAVLFGALVGFPYVRGILRANESAERFAKFAACFWGGEEVGDPGLGLPPGEEAAYAGRVLRGERGWPASCRTALSKLAPAPVVF